MVPELRMPMKRKLSAADATAVLVALRWRRDLLRKISTVTVKALAARYRVSRQTIYAMDEALHGAHASDPKKCYLNWSNEDEAQRG